MTASALSRDTCSVRLVCLFYFVPSQNSLSLRPRLVLESFGVTMLVPPPIYSIAHACDVHDSLFNLPHLSVTQGTLSNLPSYLLPKHDCSCPAISPHHKCDTYP